MSVRVRVCERDEVFSSPGWGSGVCDTWHVGDVADHIKVLTSFHSAFVAVSPGGGLKALRARVDCTREVFTRRAAVMGRRPSVNIGWQGPSQSLVAPSLPPGGDPLTGGHTSEIKWKVRTNNTTNLYSTRHARTCGYLQHAHRCTRVHGLCVRVTSPPPLSVLCVCVCVSKDKDSFR